MTEAPFDEATLRDGNSVYRDHFDSMTRQHLKKIVTEDLIEEHRRKPTGRHSEALERVLAYFRRLPLPHQYALHREPDGGFRIVALSTERRGRPKPVDETHYTTLNDAYHGVFLKKLKDLMEV